MKKFEGFLFKFGICFLIARHLLETVLVLQLRVEQSRFYWILIILGIVISCVMTCALSLDYIKHNKEKKDCYYF